jgi:hypothetical protein
VLVGIVIAGALVLLGVLVFSALFDDDDGDEQPATPTEAPPTPTEAPPTPTEAPAETVAPTPAPSSP